MREGTISGWQDNELPGYGSNSHEQASPFTLSGHSLAAVYGAGIRTNLCYSGWTPGSACGPWEGPHPSMHSKMGRPHEHSLKNSTEPCRKRRACCRRQKGHPQAGLQVLGTNTNPLPLDKSQLSPGTKIRVLIGGKKLSAPITGEAACLGEGMSRFILSGGLKNLLLGNF